MDLALKLTDVTLHGFGNTRPPSKSRGAEAPSQPDWAGGAPGERRQAKVEFLLQRYD